MKIIYILGGFLKKNRDGNYRSDKLSYLRVLAGYYLYKKLSKKNKIRVIVSGGKGIYKDIPDVPPVAQVMSRELTKLGINFKEIKSDTTDFTYPELVWLKKYITDKLAEALIVSNSYHLPRVRTMMNLLPELKKIKGRVKLISAEKIVVKHNKKMGLKIKNLTKSPQIKKLIASEKKGVNDLKRGNYKFK